jgi:hypothetical protein
MPLDLTASAIRGREDEAFRLRQLGYSYEGIAQILGYVSQQTGRPARNSARAAAIRGQARALTFEPTTRRFGVEIEFVGISRDAAAQALREAGLEAQHEGYGHATTPHWKVVHDGSISRGGEAVSPILAGEDGYRQVRTAIQALRSAGANVSTACGLHVHHEVADLSGEQLARLFEQYAADQDNIDGLVSRSRRDGRNQYCRRLRDMEVQAIGRCFRESRTAASVDRYKTLNVASFPRYGTIEFRQHQGTMDARKVIAWIKFGQAMIELAKTATLVEASVDPQTMIDKLVQEAQMAPELRSYFHSRISTLASA